MIFEHSPKTYKRISQGLVILTMVGVLGIGLGVIKRDYTTAKRRTLRTAAAASFALLYHVQYKRSINKSGKENNEN